MKTKVYALFIVMAVITNGLSESRAQAMEWVRVSADHRSFAFESSGRRFTPWGFNYDHDEQGRLIEDYWEKEWPRIEEDIREMKDLGANVVRIHLQLGRFMSHAEHPNETSLDRLARLVALAERLDVYLDLTGLGCYHKKDVPAWYDALAEPARWAVQARFWDAIARRCAGSPAVFCYDLMNEPVLPGGKRKGNDWLGPAFGDKHFVQFITLDQAARPRHEVARQWVHMLADAIRKHDRRHLITVGLVPWSLDRPGLTSGFVPDKVADDLDFVSVHIYPKGAKVEEALETLKGFAIGKPVLIEETFPLSCSISELGQFLDKSRDMAAGCVGFYWGKTLDELQSPKSISDAITRDWLTFFQRRATELRR